MNTSEQHKPTRVSCYNLIYFSDRFRLITQADNKYGNTVEPPIRRHKVIGEKNAGKLHRYSATTSWPSQS